MLQTKKPDGGRPDVSVVLVAYNIPREAPRTLLSLSASYQRYIHADQYEIIVVDNGSEPPLDIKILENLAGNFRLVRIDPASPSPAQAVNRGLAEAEGEIVGVMVDGARIASPGLVHFARHGARLFENAIVASLGWYLGYDFQRWAIRNGYNQTREDALLEMIGWPLDGYRLFEIATLDESSVDGWLQPISESNALFLRREIWSTLGGFDERFDAPGGGLVNHDIFRRAVELPEAGLVLVLGEGTFHQLHGGVATNASVEQAGANWTRWLSQYESIVGRPYEWPKPRNPPTYIGALPRPALAHFVRAAVKPVPRDLVEPPSPSSPHAEPPLGLFFDEQLWSLSAPVRPCDPVMAALVDLMHTEFRAGRYSAAAALARLIRDRAPDEPEPQRLLSLLASWPPQPWIAEYQLALAKAHRLLGE